LEVLVFFSGLIFETEIQAGDDSRFFQGSLDQYWKQVRRNYWENKCLFSFAILKLWIKILKIWIKIKFDCFGVKGSL
jgi:hypothetical protein